VTFRHSRTGSLVGLKRLECRHYGRIVLGVGAHQLGDRDAILSVIVAITDPPSVFPSRGQRQSASCV
jgi:hypothetical protein